MEKQLDVSGNKDRSESTEELTTWEQQTVRRKKWVYQNSEVFTANNKKVVPKRELFQVLCDAHNRVSHRGRQITEKWLQENYAEISQKVVNVFVQLCPYHAEKKPITSRVKDVHQPMEAPTFLSLIEIDLMDFRKCPCDCKESHTWVMNVTDHHTKHVALYPLTDKSGERVLEALQQHCHTYGYPQKIISDNGKEFCNKRMETFCQNNGITMKHGAPRTPTTQGLIERSNRSCKEDMHTLIASTATKVSNLCKKLGEISYTRNITYHTAIKTSPYEAVYGIKPHRELLNQSMEVIHEINSPQVEELNHNLKQNAPNSPEVEADLDLSQPEERQRKRRKISKNQEAYNQKMVQQSKKKAEQKSSKFNVGDVVSIKIDKVDKPSPFYPNMLLGKITELENHYARVVTRFGKIQTLISPTRLTLCTATNLTFDYSKEISFTCL